MPMRKIFSLTNNVRHRLSLAGIAVAACACMAQAADTPHTAPRLGTALTAAEVSKWDLTIFPDGRGLPAGKGTAKEGRIVFENQCASCHGDDGRGATAEELVADPQALTEEVASKAIGPYWPYATTVFDFVRRSMPAGAPGSLSADELYAVTAYLLAANKVIAETDEINAKTLPPVKMPNRDGFDWIDVKK
jgi:mono/diheme cytochrome c family protein